MADPARDPLPVAYVEWVDSGVDATGWEDREEVIREAAERRLVLLQSAGLLVSQDADSITLALGLSPARDDVVLAMSIPRSSIRKMCIWNPRLG